MNKATKVNQGVKQGKLEWIKMNDFFPSEKDKKEFEIGHDNSKGGVRCPLCDELIGQAFIRAGDTPIFSGWGPCSCSPKQ